MSAADVLAALQQRGATVRLKPQADGEPLLNVAPRSALDTAMLETVRAHRAELIAFLQSSEPAPEVAPDAGAARFWADVAEAINQARRGAHLVYTPALSWAWKAANHATKRNLSSAELCQVARGKTTKFKSISRSKVVKLEVTKT